MIDTKPFPLDMRAKSLGAGEPIHHMRIRLTLDGDRWIRDVQVDVNDSPFSVCPEIASTYRQLIGLRVEAGFTIAVKRMFRGARGCTHLTELIPVIATTAMQTIWTRKKPPIDGDAPSESRQVSPLDGCHALQRDGEVVRRYYRRETSETKVKNPKD